MMKCVLVLALLHFCVSVKSDTNLITEIIHGLESLSKVNFTYNGSATIKVPARCSSKMPHNCSGVVIKELEKLLSNVTVQEEDEHYIQELLKNLNILPHRHNDANNPSCCMKAEHMSNQTFRFYKSFFKKWNRII
ncbi:uncharacterized protein LOC143413923 [Maylandia zebra]|uniref:uncharacterized protein LOC143413923 n=1 Tax=Maylandia zebra TaxID=106582 RepID=UPI00403D4753